MSKHYILSLDQGTTSSRALLFDHQGKILAQAQRSIEQYYPQPGWVEHDPNEIWYTQSAVAAEVLAKADISASQIATIGVTNQRETTILWDRKSSLPIGNAIVWQDRRTADYCSSLREAGFEQKVREKTGLILDAYFSATKIRWMLNHIPGARERAARGELCFGTVDSWLIWKLTRGRLHITDVSNASRTLLFNIHTLTWDEELLQLFEIPHSLLPEVRSSSELYGVTSNSSFAVPIPISGIAGDQQAALFGQLCTKPCMTKTTYGTGCFMVMNTGSEIIHSQNNLISTIAWKIGNEVTYALEGSVFVGGAVIQWLRDEMEMIRNSSESETLARSVPDNGGVYFVPALTGLGAPYWDPYARGAILGITRGTCPGHIARAALEGIAFQVEDVLQAMEHDVGKRANEMRVDGGAVANHLLMQFQSDISQKRVIVPQTLETTALGAAYLAGLATGFWTNCDQLHEQREIEAEFTPHQSKEQVKTEMENWHRAVGRASNWVKE